MNLESRLAPVLSAAAQHAAAVDADGVFPKAAVDALRESGLLGLTLPPEVGGLGQGPVELVDTVSAIASACGSTAMIYLMHVSAAMPVLAAPPADGDRLLRGMADGSLLGTLAFSEKGSRSHFWAPVSQAEAEGDAIRVRAEKSWVTSAGYADVYIVSTRSAASAEPVDGLAVDLYVVEGDADGLKVAAPWHGLGLRGNMSAPMLLDVLVSPEQRLGEAGTGFATMLSAVLPWFNLGNAAVTLGLADAALFAAIGHITSARLQHLDSRLCALPTIRHRVGEAAVTLSAHQASLRAAATAVANPDDTTMLAVLAAKAGANDAALTITDEAMRVCGGAAFSKHLPVERAFRDVRAGHVMAPTSDVLYDMIARARCGMDLM
jgi:alkylation response protein AidB-like acyl-CoA dehydrogenase